MVKKFIRIQLRKWVFDPKFRGANTDTFVSYYRTYLCHLQNINNELLAKILYSNRSCTFFVDRSISFLTTSSHQGGYATIDEFRRKVPLTNYDDYRNYVDRMIQNGEKNLLSSDKIIYYATSSGTTGKIKFLPICKPMVIQTGTLSRAGSSAMWTALASSQPPLEQRSFQLYNGKKAETFPKSKDGTPIGQINNFFQPSRFFLDFDF
jgi:hypothetical protein